MYYRDTNGVLRLYTLSGWLPIDVRTVTKGFYGRHTGIRFFRLRVLALA
ncbi:hypothetical protein BVI434_370045 [Burkholderia vietnamiensis]|nr:hypothetical protein BVI434_370045 [Burkholderia vietnamiensis]